jgi:hypothetical protein
MGLLQPRDGKWLTDIGPGVQEIRIPYDKEAQSGGSAILRSSEKSR